MIEQISIFDLLSGTSRFIQELKCGSGFAEGKFRITVAARQLPVKELAEFLKKEYGIGGHSITYEDGVRGFADHDGKGIKLLEFKSDWKELHSWTETAKEIKKLVACDEYLTAKEKLQMKVWCPS